MDSVHGETHLLSFNVCQRCKHRKKKCDRALPGCARCTRLRLPCNYSTSQSHGLSTPPESVDAVVETAIARYAGYDRHFFPELINPFTFITPQSVFLIPSGEHGVLDLDEQLTEQCWSIISRDGAEDDGILSSCSTYFNFVHKWLPILSKEILYDQILVQRNLPKGEVAILVLTIHLVSQLHQTIPRERTSLEQLYHTTKGLYSFLMSTGRSNIELVQAGILLAFYEHSQALHEATYQTLGACARMGYLLGFDKTLSHDFQPSPDAEFMAARQRQVWWGIIILERISMLEYPDKKLPFAITKINSSDMLPSEDGIKQPVSRGLKQSGEAPRPGTVELSVHARVAQGAYLLGHVIDRVSASNPNSSSCGAVYVDNTLRSYAMDLLQPSDHGHLCWPYSICLSAILMLNCYEVSVEPKPMEVHEKEVFQSRAALGLKSALRMMLDGSLNSSSASDAQLMAVPIWVFHRAQYAAVLSLDFGIVDEDTEGWMAYIQTVKQMLRAVEVRSKLASNYLKAVEDAEDRRAKFLACQAHC